MDIKTAKKFEVSAEILKALAHPTRLILFSEISKGEKCVCDLTPMINADLSTVSKHLAVLKNGGLVNSRKEGTKVYYSLKKQNAQKLFSYLDSVIDVNAKEYLMLSK